MAYIRLESGNPQFSFLIRKNPATGLLVKRLRHGLLFGFYSHGDETQYNCYFKDHNSQISFDTGQSFEFNDTTRYSAAIFPAACCDEFFRDAMLKNLPDDTTGFDNALTINGIRARRRYIDIFAGAFPEFRLEVETLVPGYYRIRVASTGTLRRLLCFTAVFCLINAIRNGEFEQYNDDLLIKYAKMIQFLDAPYFVRYVFKSNLLQRESTFGKVRQYLESDGIKLKPGHNMLQRLRFVERQIDGQVIVDVGCGEGKYFRNARNVSRYFGIERDERRREQAERLIEKKQYDNITLLESLDELPEIAERKTVLLTEVIEHNEKADALALLRRCLMPNSRVIVTTPNRDFNVHYSEQAESQPDESESAATIINADTQNLRHEDHRFEFPEAEFREFITESVTGLDCKVTFSALGDMVDGICPQSVAVVDIP